MSYLFENPINMPRGSHYGSDYWIVYSYKLKRKVHLYSMLEYANFISLEMDSAVEFYCEQPLKIVNTSVSEKTSSIFDFWVQYTDSSSEFQEIKYNADIIGNDKSALRTQKQIEFQKKWCDANGFNYRVITDNDLYTGQFVIPNLTLLHTHLLHNNRSISKKESEHLFNQLSIQPLTIGNMKFMNILAGNNPLSILAHQFYLGKITMNINERPIDNYTEVRICEQKNIIF